MKKLILIDRDGTIIVEPDDFQVDSLSKLSFVPAVIPSLIELAQNGFRFVLITNQDGLGTQSFPKKNFQVVQDKMIEILESQGVEFYKILVCPHFESQHCDCRKPKIGLLSEILVDRDINWSQSYLIGDRDSDIELGKKIRIKSYKLAPNQDWLKITKSILGQSRKSSIIRKTNETNIKVDLNLDDAGDSTIQTGLNFFDHMLEQLARHSGVSLNISAEGDLENGAHHLIEDVALCLGEGFKEALSDKIGINRYGFLLPMDDCSAQVAIDLSGRSFCVFEGQFTRDFIADFPSEMTKHFFQSFASALQANINVVLLGENNHHKIESAFKALGRSLKEAVTKTIGSKIVPSTKGVLI